MTRLLLLMASALSVGAATLSLQSCASASVEAAPPSGPLNDIVALPDGSTFVAAKNSMPRAVAGWLASRESAEAEFGFAGFAEDKPRFTSEGLGHAASLATILRAAPAASVEIAGDEAQARALATMLGERGIADSRIKVVPAAGLGSVMLRINRSSTAGMMTARS